MSVLMMNDVATEREAHSVGGVAGRSGEFDRARSEHDSRPYADGAAGAGRGAHHRRPYPPQVRH